MKLRVGASRALVFAPYVFAASILSAMSWPLDAPVPAATFGTLDSGHFLTAIELASDGGLVHSADEGELVFAYDSKPASYALPSTIGSYVVIEHPRGMAAVYAELARGSASGYLEKVKAGTLLGTAGASGIAKGSGLLFGLFDREAERWVNPFLLLPPLTDTTPPVIRSALLSNGSSAYTLGEAKSLPQGVYTVSADLGDSLASSWSVGNPAPYYVRLMIDGAKVAEFTSDVAAAKDGSLRLSSQSPKMANEYARPDGKVILASRLFARGRSIIEILVRDYAGNERRASWTITLE
jgi:hypothetical protein